MMLEKLPDAIGEALQGQRAGLEKTVAQRLPNAQALKSLDLHSLAFPSGGPIPLKYTADGGGVSPPLSWSGVDAAAASLVLIVEDADSPTPHPLVHAIVVDLDGRDVSLPEGALDSPDHQGIGLHAGKNSFLQQAWLPPDPPHGHGLHRYVFQLFALSAGPEFSSAPGRQEVFDAIASHAYAGGVLIGTYERTERVKPPSLAAVPQSEAVVVEAAPGVVPGLTPA